MSDVQYFQEEVSKRTSLSLDEIEYELDVMESFVHNGAAAAAGGQSDCSAYSSSSIFQQRVQATHAHNTAATCCFQDASPQQTHSRGLTEKAKPGTAEIHVERPSGYAKIHDQRTRANPRVNLSRGCFSGGAAWMNLQGGKRGAVRFVDRFSHVKPKVFDRVSPRMREAVQSRGSDTNVNTFVSPRMSVRAPEFLPSQSTETQGHRLGSSMVCSHSSASGRQHQLRQEQQRLRRDSFESERTGDGEGDADQGPPPSWLVSEEGQAGDRERLRDRERGQRYDVHKTTSNGSSSREANPPRASQQPKSRRPPVSKGKTKKTPPNSHSVGTQERLSLSLSLERDAKTEAALALDSQEAQWGYTSTRKQQQQGSTSTYRSVRPAPGPRHEMGPRDHAGALSLDAGPDGGPASVSSQRMWGSRHGEMQRAQKRTGGLASSSTSPRSRGVRGRGRGGIPAGGPGNGEDDDLLLSDSSLAPSPLCYSHPASARGGGGGGGSGNCTVAGGGGEGEEGEGVICSPSLFPSREHGEAKGEYGDVRMTMIKVPVCPVRFGDGEDEPPLPPRPKDTSPGCVSALSAVLIDNGPSAVAALSRSVHDEEEGKEGGEEVEGLCLEESQAEEEERDVGVLSEEGDYTENENLEGEFRRAEISFSEEEDESFAERHLDLEHTAAPPPSKRLLAAARRAHRQKRRSCNLPSPRRNSAASQNRRRAGAGDSAVVLRRSLPGPPSLFLPVASPVSMRRQRGSTRPDAAFPSAAAIAGYDSGLPLEFKRNQLQMKATTARRPQFAPPPRRRSPPCGARPPGGKSSSPHIHAGRRQRQEGGGGMKSLWTEGRALAADRIRISAPQVFSCDLHSPPHPAAEPPKGGTGKPPGCSREDEATGPPPPPAVSVFPHAAASPSPRRSACPAVLSSSPRPSRPVQPSPVKPPERQPEEPPINCSSLSPTAVQRVLKAIRQQKQKKEEEEEQEEARAVTPPKRSSVSPANVTPTPSKLTATHPGSPEGPPSLLRGLCLEDSENPLPGTDNCKFLHGMDDDFVAPLPQRAKRHIRQRETHNFGGATAPCQRPVQPRPPPFSPGPAPRYPRFRGRHSVPSSPPQEVKQRRQEMKPHCRDSESPPPTFFARTLARALARSRREAAREKNTLRSSDKRSHPPPLRSGRYRSITPPPPVVQHKRTAAPPKIAVPAYWRWSKRPDLFGNEDRQKGVGGEKSKDTPLERNQTFGDRDSTARRSVGREGRRKVQSGSSGLPSCEPPRRLGRGREASVCVSVREVEENDDAQRQEDTQKEEVEGDSNAGPPVGIGCSSSISAISVSSRAPLLNILNKVCPAALRGEGVAEGESIMGFLGEAGAGTAETRGVDLIALCQNLQSQLDLLKKTFASSSSEKKGESTTNTPIREPMQTSATPGDQPDIKKPEAETPQAVAVTEKNRTDSPPTPVPQRIHHPVDVLRLPPPSQPPVVQRNSFSAQQTPDDEETISNENAASSVRRGPPEWATGFRSSPQPSSVTGLSGALMGMGAGSALSPSLPFPGSPSSDISRLFAFLRPGRGTTGSTPVPPPNLPRPPPSAAFTRHTRSEAANFLRPSTMHCERLSIVSAVPGNPRQTQSEMGGLRQERSADTARFPGPSSVRSGSARAQSVESAAVFVSADAQLQGRESAFGDRCDFPLRSSYPASVGLNFSQASSVSGGRGRGTEDLEGEGGSVKGGGRVSVDGGKQKAPSGRDEKEEKADGDEGERASVTSAVPSIATEDLRSPVPLSPDLRPSVCSQKERESRSPSMTPHASPKWPTHRSPTARLDSEEREQIDRPTFPTVVPQPPYASPLPWWPPPPGHAEANLPTISLQAPPQPTPPSMTPQSPSLNFTFGRTPLFSADTCAGRSAKEPETRNQVQPDTAEKILPPPRNSEKKILTVSPPSRTAHNFAFSLLPGVPPSTPPRPPFSPAPSHTAQEVSPAVQRHSSCTARICMTPPPIVHPHPHHPGWWSHRPTAPPQSWNPSAPSLAQGRMMAAPQFLRRSYPPPPNPATLPHSSATPRTPEPEPRGIERVEAERAPLWAAPPPPRFSINWQGHESPRQEPPAAPSRATVPGSFGWTTQRSDAPSGPGTAHEPGPIHPVPGAWGGRAPPVPPAPVFMRGLPHGPPPVSFPFAPAYAYTHRHPGTKGDVASSHQNLSSGT